MDSTHDTRIAAIRRFNRFYTRRIGVLNPRLFDSEYSLTEMRVLWEIAHAPGTTATKLSYDLGLDPGYLSRILAKFRACNFITLSPAEHDTRLRRIEMTGFGRRTMATLEKSSSDEVAKVVAGLTASERARLVQAMASIEGLLESFTDPKQRGARAYELREPRAGEYGWIVQRHGELYAQEYGWDSTFEGLVAEIVAKYLARHDPERERCWVAERAGELVGCVLLIGKSASVAQLRILLVDPAARGQGLGSALVDQCVRFAREAGYRKLVLWTQSVLTSARRIYEKAGFTRTSKHSHRSFGHALTGEYWELAIAPAKSAARSTRRAR